MAHGCPPSSPFQRGWWRTVHKECNYVFALAKEIDGVMLGNMPCYTVPCMLVAHFCHARFVKDTEIISLKLLLPKSHTREILLSTFHVKGQ